MYRKLLLLSFILLFSDNVATAQTSETDLNSIAADYVRLGLKIGLYDSDFVDAYYGPDSLKPIETKQASFPLEIFLKEANELKGRLSKFFSANKKGNSYIRAHWMTMQLTAFSRRMLIYSGKRESFDLESMELFGVVAPTHPENYFKDLVSQLDARLPGNGSIADRFQNIAKQFVIPQNKIDTVFKAAIAASRKRTLANYDLPAGEHFTLEYVTGKSWSGYNWYQGNYTSNIQINTDIDIFIERAIDVASHESYPGHHVYNMLLEKNLYREKGWLEVSLYPLFSPQSLIAEGSANYGIDVAFPGMEKTEFAKNVLLPLAGLDTTAITRYFELLALKGNLNFARNEVARGLINNTMNEEEAIRWLMEYGLNTKESALKSISFIRKYGSYVINYNYGLEMVAIYIESNGGVSTAPGIRWKLFWNLLSNEITPDDLLKH